LLEPVDCDLRLLAPGGALESQFAANNAITTVSFTGLLQPKPRKNVAGAWTFHRFGCHLSGAYFDVMATVVLTGHGGFNVTK
jgi:hypothetical protein